MISKSALTAEYLSVLAEIAKPQASDEQCERLKDLEIQMQARLIAEDVTPPASKPTLAELSRAATPWISVIIVVLIIIAGLLGIDVGGVL